MNVYDAVAGRVGYQGLLTAEATTGIRDTVSTSTIAVPADEVLFRREDAPIRYEEEDLYDADRNLQSHQILPDSDLLKAVHAYVADFYDSIYDSCWSLESMDESALLAVGILLEEAASYALGESGELAFDETSARFTLPLDTRRGHGQRFHEDDSLTSDVKHADIVPGIVMSNTA